VGELVGPDCAQDLQPAHLGQFQVEQHQLGQVLCRLTRIGARTGEEVDGFLSVMRHNDRVDDVVSPERPLREQDVVWIVLDE